MKAIKIEDALALADKQGEVTLKSDAGRVYRIRAVPEPVPFDPANIKRVKMPGITRDELVESVREGREQGYK